MNKNEGTWQKVFCPEDACMSEEERIDLPVSDTSSETNDAWVETFCPEDTCEITSPSSLP